MLGRLNEAEICLCTIGKSSEFPESIYNLATLLKEKGELVEAIELYYKVIDKNKNYANAHNGLLECLRELCLWEKAEKIASKLNS